MTTDDSAVQHDHRECHRTIAQMRDGLMPKRQDSHEEWAIAMLDQIIALDRRNRDALPGSAVRHVKQAKAIMAKRRRE